VSHEKNEGRISALEAENAELRARVDLLEGRTPAPKPLPIEGTRVFKPKPVSSLIEPTDDELVQLAAIGVQALPQFGPKYELSFHQKLALRNNASLQIEPDRERIDADFRKAFKTAFIAAGSFFRTPEPNHKRYCGYWMDCANDWLRSFGLLGDVECDMLILAAICHHDIPWTDGRENGSVFELGVDVYVGTPAGDAWRETLRTGKIREPTPKPPWRRMAPRSPSRVTYG